MLDQFHQSIEEKGNIKNA